MLGRSLKMRSRKGMKNMIWLVIAIVIMFVIVAILASFFQSRINKGGGTIRYLADQGSWKSVCPA